jgi:hypothetical protein
MAATHLTLEEAAERLGITPEEFKKRLKTDPAFKVLVPIRDGSTLRFKPAAVDELARQLGAASDPELPLAPLGESMPPDSDDFKVPSLGKGEKKGEHDPLPLATGDDDIFSLSSEAPKVESKKPKAESDSDARLDPAKKKAKSEKGEKGDKEAPDAAVVPTEEIAIDVGGGPGSAVIKGGSSSKLSAPKSSGKLSSGKLSASDSAKNLANPGAGGDSSEFELSLDADSDDFELKLNTESSDEVALGEMPKDAAGSGKRGGESGINLRDPADSGISLEKGKAKEKAKEKEKEKGTEAEKPAAAKTESDSDVDFELTLDSSSAASGLKLGGLKGKGLDPDSDSEFELTLDDSGGSSIEHAALGAAEASADKGDIFETDFEIPPMEAADSGSEAVALESDTDLEKSDDVAIADSDVVEDASGSEVVLLEDEGEAPKAKGKGKPAAKKKKADDEVDLADVEEAAEEDTSASKALKGVKGRRRDEEEEEEEEEEAAAAPVAAGAYRPVPWGAFPGIVLLLAFPLVLVGGILGFEMLQTMWGYQQPRKPAAPLVRALATNLDMELKDQ